MKNSFLIFLLLQLTTLGFSQSSSSSFELTYDVNRIYPPLSITRENLTKAETLVDLNKYYKPSWVSKYLSVEVSAIYKGRTRKAFGKTLALNEQQKKLIETADVHTDVSVKVKYMPKNTLSHNEPKEINFKFMVDTEKEAKYIGGTQKLKQYIKKNTIDKIPHSTFKQYQLTAVKFTINEKGEVANPEISESSGDKKADEILMKAIRNMPNWQPAEYGNGLRVAQEFVLMVGDKNSCVINLFNIDRDKKPEE